MPVIRIGNAPCSWGTLEFESTPQSAIAAPQMLDELVSAGYSGSELGDWGFMPTEPHELAQHFSKRNLALTGAFVGVRLRDPGAHAGGMEQALKTATLLARTAELLEQTVAPFLVLADENGIDPQRTKYAGRISPDMGLSDSDWQIFAEGVSKIAQAVSQNSGLRTVFHHHCAGFVETPAEIERIMSLTDPDTVGLVFDTGHFCFGAGRNEDLLPALNRLKDRIQYVHFKDCDPNVMQAAHENQWDYFTAVHNGVFCELGRGSVDFAAVKEWLLSQHYAEFITVEQDVLPGMGSPYASAVRNREYLRSIGL